VIEKGKKKWREWREKRKGKKKTKEDKIKARVDKAQRELPPKIAALEAKKPSLIRFKAMLLLWRLRYRMSSLRIQGNSQLRFVGKINPELDLGNGYKFTWDEIIRVIHEIADEYFRKLGEPAAGTGAAADPIRPDLARNPAALAKAVGERQGHFDASGLPFEQGPHHKKPGVETIYETGGSKEKAPSYAASIAGTQGVDVGAAFHAVLSGPGADLSPEAARKAGLLFGIMFGKEPTHPNNTFGHKRDLVHALMATNMLKLGMPISELRNFPAAPTNLPWPIQAGAQIVTKKVIGKGAPNYPEGYGPGPLPTKMFPAEKIRLEREIKNFEAWVKATGELEKVSKGTPSTEDLKRQVKDRLAAFLKGRA
jgi:hypothetical protein